MIRTLIIFIFLFFFVSPFAQATTYYVSPTGSNSNPGTQAFPFKTISYAITQESSGDTLYLLPGTYNAANGENFSITAFPANTTLEGEGLLTTIEGAVQLNTAVIWVNGIDGVHFKNFFITGAGVGASGAEIAIFDSRNSSVEGVTIKPTGGFGILVNNATVEVKNTLIYGNPNIQFAAIFGQNGSNVSIKNCTIANNNTMGILAGGTGTRVAVRNSIISSNAIGLSKVESTGPELFSSYNDVYNNSLNNYDKVTSGTGDISVESYFISTSEANYRLMSSGEGYSVHSPCIDAGDPADDYSLEPSPNGSRINMGYLGGTSTAELSYVAPSPTPESPSSPPPSMKLGSGDTIAVAPEKVVLNPERENIKLQFRPFAGNTLPEKATIIIFDSRGKVVYKKERVFNPSDTKVNMTISSGELPPGLTTGIYTVTMYEGNTRKATGRLIFKPW